MEGGRGGGGGGGIMVIAQKKGGFFFFVLLLIDFLVKIIQKPPLSARPGPSLITDLRGAIPYRLE